MLLIFVVLGVKGMSMVDFKDREHTFEEIFEFWKKKLIRLLSMKNESSEPEFEVGHVSSTCLIRS